MSSGENKIVRHVLEETGYAYMLSCETSPLNADYAEYASSQSLSDFQAALDDPELTYEQLCKILRKASHREASRSCKTPWSLFMANCLKRSSNNNKARCAR
ncbi:MAG: hypothetical protein H6853_03885 [Rhodospirillales bacterium]|nr:hypothetical protein [Alphaproteobacteria bacterium]USO04418.1 MAG: hypothetical protein H6853_03885 [Rhodospirillales bacterium]